MHSHHRNSISTIEEWLSLEKEQEQVQDNLDLYILGIYPVQGTALLYIDETICQEEK